MAYSVQIQYEANQSKENEKENLVVARILGGQNNVQLNYHEGLTSADGSMMPTKPMFNGKGSKYLCW
ncbi:uncharacterized protein LOC120333860 isoform X2 [Styela clava]